MTETAPQGAASVEVPADFGEGPAGEHAYWMAQDEIAEKQESAWIKRARKIVRRYRDERSESGSDGADQQDKHRFNILWSNVQTLSPLIYSRVPKPDVERQFKDNDPLGRTAAMVLERSLTFTLRNTCFDEAMKAVVEDRLLPGRGTARVLYVPHFGNELPPQIDETTGEEIKPEGDPPRELIYEECQIEYTFWEDYREGPARKWKDVPWIRYTSFLRRDELVARFKKKGEQVNLDHSPKGEAESTRGDGGDASPDVLKKATIWEIWDKTNLKVVWLAPGTPGLILDEQDDPLKLPGFYPSPEPLLATTTNDKRIPVPDYIEYQDQADELDRLTGRIDKLTRALKVSGIYAGEEKSTLQNLIDDGTENKLIPVLDWAAFSDKGGLAGMIQWVPIQQIAETLIQLYNARDRAKQVLYEVMGIADIMRGATDPNETLGAQQLKAQFGTTRVSRTQRDVARFARDLIRLVAAIISEHFSPQTISMISGMPVLEQIPPPPQGQMQVVDPQTGQAGPSPQMMQYMQTVGPLVAENQKATQQFQGAVQLLKRDVAHDFRVDIEADSTVAADEQADKASRVEFLTAMGPLLAQLVPFAKGNPAFAGLSKDLCLFAVRGFRVGRPLEESFETAFDQIGKMPPEQQGGDAKSGAPTQPDPASIMDAQTNAQSAQSKAKNDQANAFIKAQQVAGQQKINERRQQADAAYQAGQLAINAERLRQEGEVLHLREFRQTQKSAESLT